MHSLLENAGQNLNTRFFNGFSSKLPSNYSLKNPQKSELGKSNKLITGVQNENDIAGIFKDKYSALLCITAYPQIPTKLLMRNQQLMRLFLLMIGRVFILMLHLFLAQLKGSMLKRVTARVILTHVIWCMPVAFKSASGRKNACTLLGTN